MISLNQTAIFVDGLTEKLAFKKRFEKDYGCCPSIRLICCNGETVKPQAYVNAAAGSLIEVATRGFRKILIVYDREKRKITAKELSDELLNCAANLLCCRTSLKPLEVNEVLYVSVADRNFENWIVADIIGLKKALPNLVNTQADQQCFEGENGKAVLKKFLKCKYRETIHAAVLFSHVRFQYAKKNSQSLSRFDQLVKL